MAKKKSLFETQAPVKTKEDRETDYRERCRQAAESYRSRQTGLQPDTRMPWYDQVLDLESRGKQTTPLAHEMAMDARRKKERVGEEKV